MFCTVAVTAARVPNCPMETNFDFEPQYITLDSSDNLYVTNQNVALIDLAITGNFAIVKFAPTGKRIFSLGTVGDIAGQFTPGEPYGIAVDSEGTIYASASTHGCVQMFKKSGSYLGEYSTNRGFGSEPLGLAFDADGNLVLTEITGLVETYCDGIFVSAFGSYGHGEGQFFQPRGLAVVK
jgi:DNA-binding beta-propeller fold protein YncE